MLSPCRGLTVDIEDDCGQTPLWYATWGDYVDCVDVLLVHGATNGDTFNILQSLTSLTITKIMSYCTVCGVIPP